jgi:hypothetical protein
MGVSIKRRGAGFRIVGQRAPAAEELVRELFEAAHREEISLERVHLALRDSRDMPGSLTGDESAEGRGARGRAAPSARAAATRRTTSRTSTRRT